GVQVQPRAVQHQRVHGTRVPVEVERGDQPAGGVGEQHDLVVVVLPDGGQGAPEVLVVGGQVGHPAGGPARADGAAVVAQVDGVEVVALGRPAPGVLGLEEVVGEPVHVQHRPVAAAGVRAVHQRGHRVRGVGGGAGV